MKLRELKQIDILNLCAPLCQRRRIAIRKSDISQYVSGKVVPRRDKLAIIAEALGVNEVWLMGYEVSMTGEEIISAPNVKMLPLVGTIACGIPILADENIEKTVACPENIEADFCLRCKGDSMRDARILDGDIVYIRQQSTVENGQIAAVLIDDEATLKRVYLSPGSLVLQAANSRYAPIVFSGDELERVRILGRAVAFFSDIK
ncbi:MAG: repressor LexA [Clostridia bacterium]|nr:repressor LexA [Clostridia bacterium]